MCQQIFRSQSGTKSEYLDFVEREFARCFSAKGYIEERAVNITSQVDSTVDFVGSKISPMKRYILAEDFGEIGRFLIQNSMKLKALKTIRTVEPLKFGSYYKCMGLIAKPEIERVVFDTFDYFVQYLHIPFEDLSVSVCSKDEDLMSAVHSLDKGIHIEVDNRSIDHYRHQYGMYEEQITGRDFNIGVRRAKQGSFFTCATFVIMESPKKKIAIDMGIGNCSLSMCKFGTTSTVSSSRMADIIDIDCVEKERFADSLIAVSVLLKENVPNHSSHHFRKKFRQYLNALLYWNIKFNYTIDELCDYMVMFLSREYNVDFSSSRVNFRSTIVKHCK